MSDPTAIPDEDRPLMDDEDFEDELMPDADRVALIDDEEIPLEDTAVPFEVQPETQESSPALAALGENGQGDLAPEDEPFTPGESAPTDLRESDA